MATNLKTIKFGESGETYYVNDCPVQISGELTADAQEVNFGSFDGLTEVDFVVRGVATDAGGSYCYITLNGTQSSFISRWPIYGGRAWMTIRKLGDVWVADAHDPDTDAAGLALTALGSAESITSLSVQAYAGTPLAAGTKYYLEGR